MERFRQELEDGRKKLQTADHLLSITYPLVKDNRLLLAVLQNLHSSGISLLLALLFYEQAFKRLPMFKDDFESMLYWLGRTGYRLAYFAAALRELDLVMVSHKASAVEFSRRDGMVICSDDYSLKKITAQGLRSHVDSLKKALLFVDGLVSGYEGVFGRGSGRVKAR